MSVLSAPPSRRTLRTIAALVRRDIALQVSYRVQLALQVLGMFVTAGTIFYVAKLVRSPPELAQYHGDYFMFALIGLGVVRLAGTAASAFSTRLSSEQSMGTLEATLVTPTPISTLLFGSVIFPLALALLQVVVLVLIGVVVFGAHISVTGLAIAVPALVLTTLVFCAAGILSASLLLLTKRGDPITPLVVYLSSILGGMVFPTTTLPRPLELASRLTPVAYGLEAIRGALLGDAGWSAILGRLGILAVFACVALPVALMVFGRALAVARRTGTLGAY
jgi:ABC-2 type transport system permease protein